MMKSGLGAVLVVGALSYAGQAAASFHTDPNPGGAFLFLNAAKDASSSTGNVGKNNTGPVVDISVIGNADFGNGFSTIKPVKDGTLTDLTFTPVDPTMFTDFSFRGQNLVADQTIDVIVMDDQGNPAQTIDFTLGNANQDFARIGIVSTDGETIKSVEVVNPGGFKEFKQIEFSGPGIIPTVPEPATWALMLIGIGVTGGVLRRNAHKAGLAA
jgi:PEP-CTERM motif